MPHHVGQRLLRDAVERRRHGRVQRGRVDLDPVVHDEAHATEPFDQVGEVGTVVAEERLSRVVERVERPSDVGRRTVQSR